MAVNEFMAKLIVESQTPERRDAFIQESINSHRLKLAGNHYEFYPFGIPV